MKSFLLNCYRRLPWFKGKFRIGKKLFASFINKNEPVYFEAHEAIKYAIPNTLENLGNELLINGIYEQDIIHFLKANVPDNSIYFDIGANIGSIGLPIIKSKKGIRYFGFEASPMVFNYLQKNFELNRITHFQLHNFLVHKNDSTEMKFYQSDLYGKSSLSPTYSNDFIIIKSTSIDNFCRVQGIEQIDWMKVDVQGFEQFVFEGMECLLKEKRVANILFEFEEWAEEQAGVSLRSAQEKLEDWGYVLFDLKGKPLKGKNTNSDTMIWAKPLK